MEGGVQPRSCLTANSFYRLTRSRSEPQMCVNQLGTKPLLDERMILSHSLN